MDDSPDPADAAMALEVRALVIRGVFGEAPAGRVLDCLHRREQARTNRPSAIPTLVEGSSSAAGPSVDRADSTATVRPSWSPAAVAALVRAIRRLGRTGRD